MLVFATLVVAVAVIEADLNDLKIPLGKHTLVTIQTKFGIQTKCYKLNFYKDIYFIRFYTLKFKKEN